MQSARIRPAGQQAMPKDLVRHRCSLRRLSQRLASAQDTIYAAIPLLLLPSRPPDIARFVVAILVRVAIKAVILRWTWPHIGEERGEVVAPEITHANTAPAVRWKRDRIRILAAHDHAVPDRVDIGPAHAVGRQALTGLLPPQASTTESRAVAEICGLHGSDLAAVTSARPVDDARPSAWRWLHGRQAPEPLPREIERMSSQNTLLYLGIPEGLAT